jgi:hypothetical protein
MCFSRLTSIVKVAFTNVQLEEGEVIEKVSFTAAGVSLAGMARVNLTEKYLKRIDDSVSTVNVHYTNGETTPQAYFIVAPCMIASGTELTFTLSTNLRHFSKTVSAPADIDLKPGTYQPFNVSLASGAESFSWTKETLNNETLLLGNSDTNAVVDGFGSLGSGYQSRARGRFSNAQQNIIVLAPREMENPGIVCTDGSGCVKKVVINWNGMKTTAGNKKIDLYVKSDNYEQVTDLFGSGKGTLFGSVYYYNGSSRPEYMDPNYLAKNSEWDLSGDAGTYYGFGLTSVDVVYTPEIIVYWADDDRTAQSLSFPNAAYDVNLGDAFNAPALSGAQTSVRYSSSNPAVATVDASSGAVTPLAEGETVIIARALSSSTYKSASASYTLNVIDARIAQSLSFPQAAYSIALDESFSAPAVSGASTSVSYESSDEDVATVNPSTGAVTIVAAGTATITATAAGDEDYKPASASYALTVTAPAPRVTATTTLKATWEKVGEDNYTLHLSGHYTAAYVVPESSMRTFFRYTKNGGGNQNTTVTNEAAGVSGDKEADFSDVLTGLHYGDVVTYYAVARVGASASDNVTGSQRSITIGEYEWDTLAAWEPTSYTGSGTNPSIWPATDESGGSISFYGAKAMKFESSSVVLTGIMRNEYAVFSCPIKVYKANESLQLVFTSCISNNTTEAESFTIAWSLDGTNYSSPVEVNDVKTGGKTNGDRKVFGYSHDEDIDNGNVHVKLVYTSNGLGSRSLYLGSVYIQKQAE